MAIVSEEVLKKSILRQELLPVYILFGDDGYLKKNYSEKIGKKIAEPDDFFNYCKFTAEANLQEVYDAVMQFPFTNDKKFVELCDFNFEECSKADFEKLCELILEVPDTAVLVIRFDTVEFDSKKSNKFKKLTEAADKVGGLVVSLGHRGVPELVKMLTNGAAKRGCSFDSAAAQYLVETTGEDISVLSNELNKLCAFASNGTITKQTVDEICVKTVEANIYELSAFILSNQTDKAILLLDDLFYNKIEPMIIFYNIASAYIDMLRVYSAEKEGLRLDSVKDTFNYQRNKRFLVDKAAQNLKRFDFNKLSLSFEMLLDAEKKLKSSINPKTVLEQLIIRLIYISVKGELVDKA